MLTKPDTFGPQKGPTTTARIQAQQRQVEKQMAEKENSTPRFIELNMNNYNEDEVAQLNEWAIAAALAIESITDEAAFTGLPESKQEQLERLVGKHSRIVRETRVAKLEAALEKLIRKAEMCDGWESFPEDDLDAARAVFGLPVESRNDCASNCAERI